MAETTQNSSQNHPAENGPQETDPTTPISAGSELDLGMNVPVFPGGARAYEAGGAVQQRGKASPEERSCQCPSGNVTGKDTRGEFSWKKLEAEACTEHGGSV